MYNKENPRVVVYAGNSIKAGILKSLLESEGIETFLENELIGFLAPWIASPGGAGSVKVTISRSDLAKAKSIVSKFLKNTD